MLRLSTLLALLVFNLYACQGGYASCIQKIKDSHTLQNHALLIPVKNHKLLIYSKQQPNAKILKYDPFLSLYLVKEIQKFAYPFDVNMHLQLGTAIVNNTTAKEGKFLRDQVGLNSLALYSEKLRSPALITSSCCSLEGIVTKDGVIQKEYIQRFLSKSNVEYGDIGIRVLDDKGSVVVSASNPYIKNNLFKKGDSILEFDRKKVESASSFMRSVLFSKIGSKHSVKVNRNGKILRISVMTSKRYGGGALSDTFLESKGIYFDDRLHIIRVSQHFKEYGLLLGDKLLQVNGTFVSNQQELRTYIENFKHFSQLLFERANFQFFVNIK